MKPDVILQARFNSSRLPGKVLQPVAGKPLLGYLIERLQRCTSTGRILVATSDAASDQPIVAYCKVQKVAYFCGSLDNVAERFLKAAAFLGSESFVRINGDSPLLDTALIDQAVGLWNEGSWDLITNAYPRSFPKGCGVELIRTSAFERAFRLMKAPEDFEHITQVFYRNPDHFRITNFSCDQPLSHLSVAVDEPEDLKRFEGTVARMTRPHWSYSLKEILAIQ